MSKARKIEEQYGKAERVWLMDRGVPTDGDVTYLFKPSALGKNRRFKHTNENQIELPASGGDVGRHTFTQDVFFYHYPFVLMSGLSASNFNASLLSSINAGLLTTAKRDALLTG